MTMKNHYPIILALSVIIAAVLWHVWRGKETGALNTANVDANNSQAAGATTALSATGGPVASQQVNNVQPQPQTAVPQPTASPAEKAQVWVNEKNGDIDFYGEIIDQNSNSVPGVDIKARVRQWSMPTSEGANIVGKMFPVSETSGSDGRFEVRGKGDGFDLESMQKTGYELSSKVSRSYGITGGSFENPVIFKMWKKDAAAQLVSQDEDTRIPYDGTPVVFDLLTGQKNLGDSATGDLRITLTRNPLNIPLGYKKPFEWHATIEAIGGGLIQPDDEFMYAAPQDGYQPKIEIDMPTESTDWKPVYDISFFAKTRGGNVYSRVKLVFRVDSPKPQTGFTIASSANPTGSPNLQP